MLTYVAAVEFCQHILSEFIVLSSAVGGELFDQLTKDVTFSEKRARFVLEITYLKPGVIFATKRSLSNQC